MRCSSPNGHHRTMKDDVTVSPEEASGTTVHAGRWRTLIVGASGAVGKQLTRELIRQRGPGSVIAALHRSPLPDDIAADVVQEFGVSVLDPESLARVFELHAAEVCCIWNLAAPLSVDTAKDPELAHRVTVGGMQSIVELALRHGVPQICFSDSIGSYGEGSPRDMAAAAWLVAHPAHDPGSDYGRQKAECRAVLQLFADGGGDARWVVIPGVLHAETSWGGGTTEYALDAVRSAVHGTEYESLPMIFASDLTEGLISLMEAPAAELHEPHCFSFTPSQLFELLSRHKPDFRWSMSAAASAMPAEAGSEAMFARLWPDSLSPEEASRDLGFTAKIDFEEAIGMILTAHEARVEP